MLSFNQQGIVSKVISIDDNQPSPWGEDEELEWLLNQTDPQVDHQQSPGVNANYQQMSPQSWSQHVQSFVGSSGIPSYQFSALQAASPIPAAHPHLIPRTIFQGPGGFAISQHHSRNNLGPNHVGGLRKVVKRKRKRTMFTTEQVEYLESVFSRKQYITREERQVIVEQLQLKDSSVKVWFQNRRIRRKRDEMEAYNETNSPSEDSNEFSSPSNTMETTIETVGSKLFQKADEFGFVTLDETEMEVIVNAIDSVLSQEVNLEYKLEPEESEQSPVEFESSSSIYEPISPAASDTTDEETSRWETDIAPEQALEKLFELHFC